VSFCRAEEHAVQNKINSKSVARGGFRTSQRARANSRCFNFFTSRSSAQCGESRVRSFHSFADKGSCAVPCISSQLEAIPQILLPLLARRECYCFPAGFFLPHVGQRSQLLSTGSPHSTHSDQFWRSSTPFSSSSASPYPMLIRLAPPPPVSSSSSSSSSSASGPVVSVAMYE
jgi:hypothetical protein